MKNKEVLDKEIGIFNLDKYIVEKINNIDIYKVDDLCKFNRIYLKNKLFSNNDISQIKIRLQLLGLDLDKKNISK